MTTRPQQLASPLVVPLLGTVLTTGLVATLFLVPPSTAAFTRHGLVLHAALYLAIAASVHVTTVWTLWRLLSDYLEPSAGTLALHLWAVTAWLPLLTILSAERSLWVACILPWAAANAIIFLNLWCALDNLADLADQPPTPAPHLFYIAPDRPLWRTLLPPAITVVTVQAGLVALTSARPWSAAALFSAATLLFLIRHPLARPTPHARRRFSRAALLQTAVVFFLLTTALTPFLQKAYGLPYLRALLATAAPPPPPKLATTQAPAAGYSGVILTLPPKPHTPVRPPTRAEEIAATTASARPITIPFDGAYWYFKAPDTRPRPNARSQRGDPIKATIRSTDNAPLAMEAHQPLPLPIPLSCCRALRLDLLNGDTRPGPIRLELLLRDTTTTSPHTLSLGTLTIPSSQPTHIPLDRLPVPESLRFRLPPAPRGQHFNEITVILRPSAERSFAASKIAIQNFVLLP